MPVEIVLASIYFVAPAVCSTLSEASIAATQSQPLQSGPETPTLASSGGFTADSGWSHSALPFAGVSSAALGLRGYIKSLPLGLGQDQSTYGG